MKIGQVTLIYTTVNYGQTLQAYALQKVLISRGHQPFLINHGININNSLRSFIKYKIYALFNFLNISRFPFKVLNEINRAAHFIRFKRKYLQIGPYISDISKTPPDADCFVVGSDQVWNHSFAKNLEADLSFYFLNFAAKKKISTYSYAASFGFEELDPSLIKMYKVLVKNLSKVSVRENSGVKICADLGLENVTVVPDPTLLLLKEEWQNLIENNPSKNVKRKVFIYALGIDFEIFLQDIIKLKSSMFEIINVFPNHRLETHPLSINQWLQEISEASFVVTNSFHGTVFSIIFEKPFICVLRLGKASKMNDRVISLLNKLGLENQIAKDPSEFKEKLETINNSSIDWDLVKKRLDEFKKTGFDFLESIGL
jgi:polysaccharide pyruvyl transferase WcaK-like protein